MCGLGVELYNIVYVLIFFSLSLDWKFAKPEAVWTKVPPNTQYVEEGSNATIIWDYDLQGESIEFAKWGKLKHENKWDKNFAIGGSAGAKVVTDFIGKVLWRANATMVIINVTLQDSGRYGCALNFASGGYIESHMHLSVFRLAVNVNGTVHQSVEPVEGGQLLLKFDAVSNYPPTGVWFAKGKEITNSPGTNLTRKVVGKTDTGTIYGFSLLKNSIGREDSGLYQAYVTFGSKNYWYKNFTVLVKYSPGNSTEFTTNTGSTILLRGTTAILSCTALSYPVPQYEITMSTTSLSNSSHGNFTLRDVRTEHEGIYHCYTRNDIGNGVTRSLYVEVGDAPQAVRSSKAHHYIAVGERLVLNCTVTAWPAPTTRWTKDGYLVGATNNITLNKKTIMTSTEIFNATLADAGEWGCVSENMFGRELFLQKVEVIWLVDVIKNGTSNFALKESSNFTIHHEVKSNLKPMAVWTRDGVPVSAGFNITMKILSSENNQTHYRFTLMKNNTQPADSGVYNVIITIGDRKYTSQNYNVSVEAAPKSDALTKNKGDGDAWLVALIIGAVALILLIVAVFCGVIFGRRIRDNDPERSPSNGIPQIGTETGATNSVAVGNGKAKGVTYRKENGREAEELGQDNGGFHRDSIYRFTVNPMFSNPETVGAQQGNSNGDNEDRHLSLSNSMYLPTNMNYETDEASVTFESDVDIEENYLSSPAESSGEPNADEQQGTSLDETPRVDELLNEGIWELEQLGLEDLGTQEEDVPAEDVEEQPSDAAEEQQSVEVDEAEPEAPNKCFILPPIVSQKEVSDAAYSLELFDFR